MPVTSGATSKLTTTRPCCPPLAPSPRALGAKGQLPGPHSVRLAYAGGVAGLAWFPHARPHCRVQPGLWSYGLPEQARERGESSTHGLSKNVQRPESLAGIARQIVERDEAGLDRPRQCCASHRVRASLLQRSDTRNQPQRDQTGSHFRPDVKADDDVTLPAAISGSPHAERGGRRHSHL